MAGRNWNWNARRYLGDTGLGAFGNRAPSEMGNTEFNAWAQVNPEAAADLGETGYQATDVNILGATEQPGFFGKDGFGMDQALGLGKLGVGLGNLYLGQQGLDLAKDTFAANKADRDRTYAANVAKYNNALARTAAVDKFYGSVTAGKRLGQG